MKTKNPALLVIMGLICLWLPAACGPAEKTEQTKTAEKADAKEKKEFTFKGTVEKINVDEKTLTVNGEDVPGWMGPMTMDYPVDKEDVLNQIKVGDQITATVFDDEMVLHDVKVVPPAPAGNGKAPGTY